MSSSYVRTNIKNFLTSVVPLEKIIDLTAEFEELNDILERNNVGLDEGWIGIQFVGSDEEPISIDAANGQGHYRETGAVYLHIVDRAKIGVGDEILARAESIRNYLRGMRISDIVIERVSPPNFEAGATLDFEGGYTSASVIVGYQRDINL
jgi:hypothetical protein